MEYIRAFSMYDAYSRAEPERRMLALARLIPIRPKAVTIVRIVAVIISSVVENPRVVCLLALLLFIAIVVVQKFLWSRSKDHGWPIEQSWCHESSSVKITYCEIGGM